MTGHRSPGHQSCYDRSGHRSLTGAVTGHVMTDPVTGYRSVPQTVPVTVDVDTLLSVLHKGRRSRVSTVSHRRKRVVSDVSGYSSTSGSSSYDSSSTSNSSHHYRRGRRSRRRLPRKERSRQRSGRRSIRKHHSQRRRTVSRHRRDKGHRPSSIRRSRTPRSPSRSFSEESIDTLPTHTSAVPTTTEHNLYSNTSLHTYQAQGTGVNLTTSAAFSAPRVSSTLHRSIPRAAATPSNPNTLWIQQSPGIFVPFFD
ncbi:hypothetical protein DPMN_018468 [Dreissena polymorpha]|uniref:Uncharacterized protein n=1 Tax=Dreissena polymorpha TaxID=45954 RepID=A0A9D4NJE4_DREPO|nr:hypothetical protein DPMN_018468 [Dreissena polymorpha]